MKNIYKVIQLFLIVSALCTGCRRQEPVIVQNNVNVATDNISNEASAPVLEEEKTAQETIESNKYPAYDFEQDNPDQPFVFIRGIKITLRYSTRDDVEKLLGSPQVIQFFERGGEGFYWMNITVCTYDQDRLSFHYDQNGAVIRITANTGYYGEVQFLGKDIKSLRREDFLNLIKNLEKNNYYVSDSIIAYEYKLSPDIQIDYTFRVHTTGSTRWIDMYYPWPWD